MTPERYLGIWRLRSVEPGRTLVMDRQPPEQCPERHLDHLVVEPLADGRSPLIDRHCGERRPGVVRRASDTFWTVGTLLMERGMLRGVKARDEQALVSTRQPTIRPVRR